MSSEDVVEVTFQPRWQERLAATVAHVRTRPIGFLPLLAFPLAGMVLLAMHLWSHIPLSASSVGAILLAIAFPFLMVAFGLWQGRQADRRLGDYRYRFDGKGLELRTANSELHLAWPGIVRVRSANGVLLLYFTKQCAQFVPFRVLGADGAEKVMAMAHAGGVPRVEG